MTPNRSNVKNYCSPIRGMREFEDDSSNLNNSALFSPFTAGQQQQLQKSKQLQHQRSMKSELFEKDKIIEAKNKEIIQLSIQIEEVINNQGKLVGSLEIQNIRKNILAELSDLLARLKHELLSARATILNEKHTLDNN